MIGWWCKWKSSHNPGRRIRAELVMRGLRERGIAVEWFDPRRRDQYQCVVTAKRYNNGSRSVIEWLHNNGCRLVMDVCDNHFAYPEHEVKLREGAEKMRTAAQYADHVVVASARLSEVVRQECPKVRAVTVIGDLADDLSVIPIGPLQRLTARWNYWLADRRLSSAVQGRVRLVWFGDKGGQWAQVGLPDLAEMKPMLRRLNQEFPLHLTVISNSRQLYRELFGEAGFPHAYLDWDAVTFREVLAQNHIAVIPASDNAFTACKSDNRVVTALSAGLAVVASPIPSYQPYEGTIALGDIEAGLRGYLRDEGLRRDHVARGRELARRFSAPGPILDKWQQVLLNT